MKKAARGYYKIEKNVEIAPGIFEIVTVAPDIAQEASAGQFVNVYLPGGVMLLPRPIGIADAEGDSLTLVYAVVGGGTETLSRFKAGEETEIMGPLGNGFFDGSGYHEDGSIKGTVPMIEGAVPEMEPAPRLPSTCLLIGGGTGIPPLYYAARQLREALGERVKTIAFLGFAEAPWYAEKFQGVCDDVYITSETEGAAAFYGNVIELLDTVRPSPCQKKTEPSLCSPDPRPAFALACGPRPMLAAAAGWCEARDIRLWVSLEERMGCGYGACAGCTVKIRPREDERVQQAPTHCHEMAEEPSLRQVGPADLCQDGFVRKKVCVHGPVFRADEVVW